MNTSFQRSKNRTDEWYTPPEIIRALGEFDLDPCAPSEGFYTARRCFTKEVDGLAREWSGRVFCNPPYTHALIQPFLRKCAEHGNAIALTFNRMDSAMWHEEIFPTADALLIMRGRVRFIRPDGTRGDSSGCGSVLIAWGEKNAECLRACGIEGKFLRLK